MTLLEFSSQFDILYNNITSNQSPGLNEYEKSVFLTNAQEQIIKEYFNALLNQSHQGVDDSPGRQIDLSSIIQTLSTSPTKVPDLETPYLGYNTWKTTLSSDDDKQVLLFLNEILQVGYDDGQGGIAKTRVLLVVPIHYLELKRSMTKPYSYPLKREAWRVLGNIGTRNVSKTTLNDINAEDDKYVKAMYLIVKDDLTPLKYTVSYIKRPQPIILTDLTGYSNISIYGKRNASGCELDPSIHYDIVERAAQLAKISYTMGTSASAGLDRRNRKDKEED